MIWNQHAALFFPHLRGGEDRHDQDTSTTFQHSWGILWQGLWSLGASSWKQRAIVWMVNQPLFTWNINPSSPETSTPLHLKHQSTLKKQKYQCHYHQKKSTFRFSVFFIVGSFQKILDKGDILWYMTCFSVVVPLSWFLLSVVNQRKYGVVHLLWYLGFSIYENIEGNATYSRTNVFGCIYTDLGQTTRNSQSLWLRVTFKIQVTGWVLFCR